MADEVKEEQEIKTGGKGKIFLFSGVGLAVVIGAAFLFATLAVPAPPEGTDSEGEEAGKQQNLEEVLLDEGILQVYDVPVIMVNLKGTNKKRVLKVHLNLVYDAPNPKLAVALLDQKVPEMRDALTTMLTEKTLEELESKEDLNLLRVELLEALNKVVFSKGGGKIQKIYYQEFIVQ